MGRLRGGGFGVGGEDAGGLVDVEEVEDGVARR